MMLVYVGVNLVLRWTVSDGHFLLESIEKIGEKCTRLMKTRTTKLTGTAEQCAK